MTKDAVSGDARSFAFGPFKLVPARQLLLRGDESVRIGGRALDLLLALVQRPGELVTKRELLAQVWPDTSVDENNLKVNMAALRRVLEDGPSARYIATVVGRGYQFVAPVQVDGPVDLPVETRSPSPPTNNLPISTTRIFGRADAIAAIRRELDRSRIVSIVGAGGIGKTTVAIAVAEQASDAFANGVWFIDLTPLKVASWTAKTIATTLGVPAHAEDMLPVVCEFLRDRQALLVLDNCEHIIDGVAPCVDRILASAPGVKVLATSREPLQSETERVQRLSGLDTPPDSAGSLDARSALAFPAVQLFVNRATERHWEFEFGDADAPIVAEICRSLDGLALAIELAATRVSAFGVAGLLRQLDDRFRLLGGRRAGPARQRTLAATLDWSYALLHEREAALLRSVSVFAGSFELDGAAAVSAGDSPEVLDALMSLAAKSLLAVEPVGDRVSYRLLQTTRAYAIGQLRTCGDANDVRRRHAEHVCAVLQRAKIAWAQCPARAWAATYGRVVDDLRDALAWASADATDRALLVRLTVAGIVLWNHLSLTEECRTNVARALDALACAGLAEMAAEMQLQLALASATMFTRGPSPEVHAVLQRTLDSAERVGDVDHRLRSLRALATYQTFQGKSEAALETLETFVGLAAEHDPSALPDGETHLGINEVYVGRLERARGRLERLHGAAHVDDAQFVRFAYDRKVDIGNVLSYAQSLTGLLDTAERTAVATVAHALEIKHGLSLSNALAVAACPTFFMSRRYAECGRYLAMLENEVRQQGIVIWSPTARFYRGALACAQADVPVRGVDDLEQAVAEFRATNHGARRSWILAVLADALARSGRVPEAVATIEEARAWGRTYTERWCMPEVMRIHASILSVQGRADEAEALLVDALEVARDIGGLSWRVRAGLDLARLWCTRSRSADARRLLAPIYAEFTEGFATPDLVAAADLLR